MINGVSTFVFCMSLRFDFLASVLPHSYKKNFRARFMHISTYCWLVKVVSILVNSILPSKASFSGSVLKTSNINVYASEGCVFSCTNKGATLPHSKVRMLSTASFRISSSVYLPDLLRLESK